MNKKSKAMIKVEKWIIQCGGKGSNWEGIAAKKLPNGKWLCEIELPKIGICVKTVSKSEHKAISSSASKAFAVIGEFLHWNLNSDATIKGIRDMGIQVGDNGEFVSTQLPKRQEIRRMVESTNR